MAIDADLNAGLITEAEAKKEERRYRENPIFTGHGRCHQVCKRGCHCRLIITIINVVGGIIIGVIMRNEEIGEALQNYAILTIGDGLVSQVPALLISVATGLIVTKSTSDEGISNDLRRQIVYNPKVFL